MFEYDVDKMIHDEVFIQSIDRREKIIRYLYLKLGIPGFQIREDESLIGILDQLLRDESPILKDIEQEVLLYMCEHEDAVDMSKQEPDTLGQADQSETRAKNDFYDRVKAKQYIEKYWKNYNPAYPNFGPYGGDCANFVSQILYAGGMPWTDDGNPAHYTQASNWYCKPGATAKDSDRKITHSWKVAAAFRNYWLKHAADIITMDYHTALQEFDELSSQVHIADVVQFNYASGVPWHTLAVTGFYDDAELKVRDVVLVSHTIDSNRRSLYRTLMKNPQDYKLRIYKIKNGD